MTNEIIEKFCDILISNSIHMQVDWLYIFVGMLFECWLCWTLLLLEYVVVVDVNIFLLWWLQIGSLESWFGVWSISCIIIFFYTVFDNPESLIDHIRWSSFTVCLSDQFFAKFSIPLVYFSMIRSCSEILVYYLRWSCVSSF